MDKGLITQLLKTPSQIRAEEQEALRQKGLQRAQLVRGSGGAGASLFGGMFRDFAAQQAAQVDTRTDQLKRGLMGAVGMDGRSAAEQQASQDQRIMQGVKLDDAKSIREAIEKISNPSAKEALTTRLTALEAKQREKDLKTAQLNAAANFIASSNPDLAEAVRSGAIPVKSAMASIKKEPKVVGSSLVAPDGKVLYTEPPEPSTTYSVLTDSEVKDLGLPRGASYKKNNKTQEVTAIGGKAPVNIGTIPKDHRAVFDYDEQGNQSVRYEVIEGSPTALAIEKEEKAAIAKGKNVAQQTNIVSGAVSDAINIIKTNESATGITGAIISQTGPFAAGSGRRDLESKITTIKANVGFDRLQKMREESPTGGALGQVAVQELVALQATLGSLDLDQSPEQLIKNLNQVDQAYVSTATAIANAYTDEQLNRQGLSDLIKYRNLDQGAGDEPDKPKSTFNLSDLDPEIQEAWPYMTDEDKKLWGWTGNE